jgi:proteic killer suppression protein
VIRSFNDRRTEALYRGEAVAAFQAIRRVAVRKLDMPDPATQLFDLRAPPGNRLEALKGERRVQHSIRINDRWRVCFVWREGAERVEIVDYY